MEDEVIFTRRDLQLIKGMIGKQAIPQAVKDMYLRMKKLIDKIDGRFTVCDLARVCLDAGYDPEEGKFTGKVFPVTVYADELSDPEEPTGEPVKEPDPEKPVKKPKEKPKTLSPGTSVRAVDGAELIEGTIVGKSGSDGALQYTVLETSSGDTYNIAAEDVEEI